MLWQTPHYKATPEGLSSAVSGPISVSLDATPNFHFDRRLGRFSFSVSLDATPNLHFDRRLGRFKFSVSLSKFIRGVQNVRGVKLLLKTFYIFLF